MDWCGLGLAEGPPPEGLPGWCEGGPNRPAAAEPGGAWKKDGTGKTKEKRFEELPMKSIQFVALSLLTCTWWGGVDGVEKGGWETSERRGR